MALSQVQVSKPLGEGGRERERGQNSSCTLEPMQYYQSIKYSSHLFWYTAWRRKGYKKTAELFTYLFITCSLCAGLRPEHCAVRLPLFKCTFKVGNGCVIRSINSRFSHNLLFHQSLCKQFHLHTFTETKIIQTFRRIRTHQLFPEYILVVSSLIQIRVHVVSLILTTFSTKKFQKCIPQLVENGNFVQR